METNEQIKVAESKDNSTTGCKNIVDNIKVECNKIKPQQSVSSSKKPLTPYQQYKNSRNQNGKKYFDFYDDIKVYTHNIWDW